jgi:transcription elongation factor GreA
LVTVSIDGDEPETYYLGSHEEKYEGAATMTPESALGQALNGHRTNETVSYTTPNGHQLSVVIISVELP